MSAASHWLEIWDVEQKRIDAIGFDRLGGTIGLIALSPNGRLIAVSYVKVHSGAAENHRRLALLDVDSGAVVRHLQTRPETGLYLSYLAFSPDGTRIVCANERVPPNDDVVLRLWDVQTGRELRTYQRPTGDVRAVAFLRNERMRVVSYGGNGHADQNGQVIATKPIKIWEVDLPGRP